MDKKKVIELIEQAIIWSRQANQYSVISNLEEALKNSISQTGYLLRMGCHLMEKKSL